MRVPSAGRRRAGPVFGKNPILASRTDARERVDSAGQNGRKCNHLKPECLCTAEPGNQQQALRKRKKARSIDRAFCPYAAN
jgi:hypothetical protein